MVEMAATELDSYLYVFNRFNFYGFCQCTPQCTDYRLLGCFWTVFALDWLAVRDGFGVVGFPMGCGCDARKSRITSTGSHWQGSRLGSHRKRLFDLQASDLSFVILVAFETRAKKNRHCGRSAVAWPAMNTTTVKMTYTHPMQAARIRFAAAV